MKKQLYILVLLILSLESVSAQDHRIMRKSSVNRKTSVAKRKSSVEKRKTSNETRNDSVINRSIDSTTSTFDYYSTDYISNQSFTLNGVSFTMIGVQGGIFTMGATSDQGIDSDSDEKPAHKVAISSFLIGQTEVTQELWDVVMGSSSSTFKGSKKPVEKVSWDDCQVFLKKLNWLTGKNFRLPTEAEWEYSARGGNISQGYKYSGSNNVNDVAWHYSNSGKTTHDVGQKKPNELGIYDMSGNVWEWCQDWYASYSSSTQTNPHGAFSGSERVIRGGSWGNDGVVCCRVSSRYRCAPGGHIYYLGLRLAL